MATFAIAFIEFAMNAPSFARIFKSPLCYIENLCIYHFNQKGKMILTLGIYL